MHILTSPGQLPFLSLFKRHLRSLYSSVGVSGSWRSSLDAEGITEATPMHSHLHGSQFSTKSSYWSTILIFGAWQYYISQS